MKKNKTAAAGIIFLCLGMLLGILAIRPSEPCLAEEEGLRLDLSYDEKEDGGVIRIHNKSERKKIKILDVIVRNTQKLDFSIVGIGDEILPGETNGAVRFKVTRIPQPSETKAVKSSETYHPETSLTAEAADKNIPKTGEDAALKLLGIFFLTGGILLLLLSRSRKKGERFLLLLLLPALIAGGGVSRVKAKEEAERRNYDFEHEVSFDGVSERVHFILVLEVSDYKEAETSAAETTASDSAGTSETAAETTSAGEETAASGASGESSGHDETSAVSDSEEGSTGEEPAETSGSTNDPAAEEGSEKSPAEKTDEKTEAADGGDSKTAEDADTLTPTAEKREDAQAAGSEGR